MGVPDSAPASCSTRALVSLPPPSQAKGSSSASVSLTNSSPLAASRSSSIIEFFMASPLRSGLPVLRSRARGGDLHLVGVFLHGGGRLLGDVLEESQAGQLLDFADADPVLRPIVSYRLVVGHDDRNHPRILPRLGVWARKDHDHLPHFGGHRHLDAAQA